MPQRAAAKRKPSPAAKTKRSKASNNVFVKLAAEFRAQKAWVQAGLIIVLFAVLGTSSYAIYGTYAYTNYDSIKVCRSRYPLLTQGSQNACVSTIQRSMNALVWFGRGHCTAAPLVVDGSYGPKTAAVVRCYQAQHTNMSVDGMVGRQTWSSLAAQCSINSYPLLRADVDCP